jgi:nucleotidyltransferase/DNA polymerase involved in DNA repair
MSSSSDVAFSSFRATMTSASPGFISAYFASSRLSHLSMWKSDLIDFVGKYCDDQNKIPSDPLESRHRIIMHVDMDCFFASVALRDRPHLREKPVAVSHSTNGIEKDFSTSEIASCNYIARAKGVRNGVFVGSVKELVPDLVILPYEFDKYDEVTKQVYDILLKKSDFVQAVSCDEAYIDVTSTIHNKVLEIGNKVQAIDNSAHFTKSFQPKVRKGYLNLDDNAFDEDIDEEPDDSRSSLFGGRQYRGGSMTRGSEEQRLLQQLSVQYAEEIRSEIYQSSRGCTASIGISHNMLLCRLATSKAKPNGVFYLSHKEMFSFLNPLVIRDLPGFGQALVEKCGKLGVKYLEDVRRKQLPEMKKELGEKTAETLYNYSQGIDHRILENKVRQSIGADINWGIRFTEASQVNIFLMEFCQEVWTRMEKVHLCGSHLILTILKRNYEGEPLKYLGCGECLVFNRSYQFQQSIKTVEQLYQQVVILFKEINVLFTEIRGVSIHIKKLSRKSSSLLSSSFETVSSIFSKAKQDKPTLANKKLTPENEDNDFEQSSTFILESDGSFSENSLSYGQKQSASIDPDCVMLTNSLSYKDSLSRPLDSITSVPPKIKKSYSLPSSSIGFKNVQSGTDTGTKLSVHSSFDRVLTTKKTDNSTTKRSLITSFFTSELVSADCLLTAPQKQLLLENGIDFEMFMSLPTDIQAEQLQQFQEIAQENARKKMKR